MSLRNLWKQRYEKRNTFIIQFGDVKLKVVGKPDIQTMEFRQLKPMPPSGFASVTAKLTVCCLEVTMGRPCRCK